MEINMIVSNGMLGVIREMGGGKFKIKWIGTFDGNKFGMSFNN